MAGPNSTLMSFNFRNLETIRDYVFYNCTGLTGTLTIPDSVTRMQAQAFEYCTGLEDVVIGNSLTEIQTKAFQYCSGLTETLIIPDSVKDIKMLAFYNCNDLTAVTFGSNVKAIENNAFGPATGKVRKITKVEIKGTEITTLNNAAFPDNLKDIYVANTAGTYVKDNSQSTTWTKLP